MRRKRALVRAAQKGGAVVSLALDPVESRLVARRDRVLLGQAEPLAPAPTVGGFGGHPAEELAHCRLVRDTEEVEQVRVGAFPVAPDELVETDEVKALSV